MICTQKVRLWQGWLERRWDADMITIVVFAWPGLDLLLACPSHWTIYPLNGSITIGGRCGKYLAELTIRARAVLQCSAHRTVNLLAVPITWYEALTAAAAMQNRAQYSL